ncbi:MAG: oxidoreductase [Pseudolabrys sp.]|nr:oxidoreductase [Pseudolabrys sp.]
MMPVFVSSIRFAAENVNIFEFSSVSGGVLTAVTPGAHIDVHLPNGLIRQYSLLRAEEKPITYEIAVKRDSQSRGGSSFLFDEIKVGMVVEVGEPRNNFPLCEAAESSILVAGGIGITPILCMARSLALRGAQFSLHYTCRSRQEAAFLKEVSAFSEYQIHIDEESDMQLLDLARIVQMAPESAHIYCCGPKPMLSAFESACADIPSERVHVEYFVPKHGDAAEGGFTIELAKSGHSLYVPKGQRIIDVLRKNGVAVPTSCEQGVCGTCETKVLGGIPDHRDALLTESERAIGKTMMICCSGSLSDRLVLDL